VLPTEATDGVSDVHVTLAVISCVEESLNTPTAVKFSCQPIGIVEPYGATVIDWMVALLTVKGTEPVTEPSVAVIVTTPGCNPDAKLPETNLTDAVLEEDQVTFDVTLCVLPSLKVPVAVKLIFVP
jgi:hypothetical protein